jgi:hypothetical protein
MDLPLVAVHGEASRPDTIRAEAREVDLQRRSVGVHKDIGRIAGQLYALIVVGAPPGTSTAARRSRSFRWCGPTVTAASPGMPAATTLYPTRQP